MKHKWLNFLNIPSQENLWNSHTFYPSELFTVSHTLQYLISRSKKDLIRQQYSTFRCQTVACFIIYIPVLIFMCVLVNFDKSYSYDPQVIFNNSDFNVHIGVTILMGLISLILSGSPNVFDGFERCMQSIQVVPEM